jgi:hypothetical protein
LFFLKLVISLQLIMTEFFCHSNGDRNSVETSFFSIATLRPWCGPMATKNLDWLGGNQNLVNTFFFFDWCTPTRVWIIVTEIRSTLFYHKLFYSIVALRSRCGPVVTEIWSTPFHPEMVFQIYFFWSLHYDQGVDWLQFKILVTQVATEIWLTTFHHFFQKKKFDHFIATRVWTNCDWKSWLLEWWPKLGRHLPFFLGCYTMLGCGLIVTKNLNCLGGNWYPVDIIPWLNFFQSLNYD